MLTFLTQSSLPSIVDALLQCGIAGATFALVMLCVVVPLIRHQLRTQTMALDLLRKSVQTNTLAVAAFQRFERNEDATHTALCESQAQILAQLQTLNQRGLRAG
jgi:hypothetical protein